MGLHLPNAGRVKTHIIHSSRRIRVKEERVCGLRRIAGALSAEDKVSPGVGTAGVRPKPVSNINLAINVERLPAESLCGYQRSRLNRHMAVPPCTTKA